MFTRFKTWIKGKWQSLKKNFRYLFGIGIVSAAGLTGADIAQFNERPIPTRDITVASEQVHLEQRGSVVEATMPWKGERGLKIKYDYGTPSLKERLADKRDKEVVAEKVPFSGSEGFKIDILLKEKPATNTFCYDLEGWEDYDFFYQPPLTQQEIDEGASRPPEIEGSYAVYHKTLKNHVVGKTNYETGKFAHIPFPYVWEVGKENQKMRAENLTYNAGKLCVVVFQSVLDKADYTSGVRVDPTFGYTTAGATIQNGNFIHFGFGTGATGTLNKITITSNQTSSYTYGGALYLKSTLGYIEKTNTHAPVSGKSTEDYTFSSPPQISAVDYYIAGWSNGGFGGGVSIYRDTGTNTNNIDSNTSYTWPSWPSTTNTYAVGTYLFSIYATYTESGGATPPAQSEFWFE